MWLLLILSLLFYFIVKSAYNLFLHPLCKIPGPRLAAATYLPEFYHDVVRHGLYIWEIDKMHQEYGPIVRINPREIHVSDPAFYPEVYAHSARKRDKDPRAVAIFGQSYSMAATVPHEHHRLRRQFLNSLFSRKSVLSLAPLFQEKVQLLAQRLKEAHHRRKHEKAIVQLDDAFSALTADTISHYCYGTSFDFLRHPNFQNEVRIAVAEFSRLVHVSKFIALPGKLIQQLPSSLMRWFKPQLAVLFDIQDMVASRSSAASDSTSAAKASGRGKQEAEGGKEDIGPRQTIFDALTDPTTVPEAERAPHRVSAEGISMLLAATETTARSLSFAFYHMMRDKGIRDRLRGELAPLNLALDRPVSFAQLEKCGYLSGVVHEAVRFTCPLTRLPRVARTETLVCHGHTIPPQTPISISSYYMNMNPAAFPEPQKFKPDRWIEAAARGINLDQYMASFTKGSRICIGINLAYMELYFAVAFLAIGFDMELYETPPEMLELVRDLGLAFPRDGDFSVQALITAVHFRG
ncbi:cytochrome P450 [Aspergillus homomorphus CBS 101889]|uniref:Benzoate 4-monooxygenase cytochrome P450 n=1 Tax=Aspergillus homomorphus (strain CBS 101889) TaxID=1450537 RepID=A0A395I5Z2_ASPHC|nr:benzoate 4-monooxygenase cytochrome P450 [Aspergillus homomorphus CBS 101889]RAL15169.1 benzoate 4-monooxygenase cytochrome P450 [Aspergillus homomorphus CBS 101889]